VRADEKELALRSRVRAHQRPTDGRNRLLLLLGPLGVAEVDARLKGAAQGNPKSAAFWANSVERRVRLSTAGVGSSLADDENEPNHQNNECKDRSPSH
jgi:hypothetical protein